jgi:hypothetical protein
LALVRRQIVTDQADTGVSLTADKIRALHEARAKAELVAADALAPGSDTVAARGALLADVAVVKGLAGPAEASGGAAFDGADGAAIASSLEALGYDPTRAFFTLSRPVPDIAPERRASRLRAQVEAVDPQLVIAVDAEAAEDVALAFDVAKPRFGEVVTVLGRRFVACDGLEASLADPARKKRVWSQLRVAVAAGPVY